MPNCQPYTDKISSNSGADERIFIGFFSSICVSHARIPHEKQIVNLSFVYRTRKKTSFPSA